MRGSVPLYLAVAQRILDEGTTESLDGMQQLPSEAELSTRLGVSRSTVREALGHLSSRSRVRKVHGVGTFLLPEPERILDGIETLVSYVDTIAQSGRVPGDEILAVSSVSVPRLFTRGDYLKPAVGPQPDYERPAIMIESLRTADSSPIIYCYDYILPPFAEKTTSEAVSHARRNGTNLLDFIENAIGIELQFSQLHARAVVVPEVVAAALDIPANSPVLELRGVTYATDTTPAYFSQNWFVTDEYEFQIVRRKAFSESV